MASAGAVACAPPPLLADTGGPDDEPSIQILFPETRTDINVCPSFIVVVAIGGVDVVDFTDMPENQAGTGHWHLYVNNEYKAATASSWYAWDMGAGAEGPVIINAVLAENDHTEIDVSATAEFVVDEADCVGGGAGSGSGSVGEYLR